MKRFKIVQLKSYGKKSLQDNRNLSYNEALKRLTELRQLNPDDVYQIEMM